MRRLLPKVLDVVRKYESNNPETILTEMNVKVHAHNIEFLPDAFYVRLGVVRSISVNVRLTDEARNIVLRHHLSPIMHIDRINDVRRNEKELAANKFAFLLLAHTCMRNNVRMIDSIRDEKLLSLADTASLLKELECAACVYE